MAAQKQNLKSSPLMIIGIGASAGGTAALKKVFSKLKISDSSTLILTQHLDDSGKKLALETISKICKKKVELAKDKLKIQPGRYYLTPPHTLIRIEKGAFRFSTAKTIDQKLSVIDHMFTTLGEQYGPRAVGIILSGDGSDGSLGIKTLNESDGLTIAQSPKSADRRSMPDAAIATAAIDHILAPEDIGREIAKYEKYLQGIGNKANQEALKEQISAAINEICEILHKQTHHDFKHYKTSTLLRRIQRRMQVLQITNVEEYIHLLGQKRDEIETLFSELLINVTSFFRDKEAFEALKTDVLTKLVGERSENQKIRIWVAGCSTGEEPYTIAILLRELIEKSGKSAEVQIIATDIDDSALNIARKGSYPVTIADSIPAKYLTKYFTKRGGRYHVNKELREMCLFSVHNLINDPPFSQLDLISCRNLLIYLGSHLQKKMFPVFHYALRKNGYLFLGTSESLTTHKELFKSINPKHRIAQRKTAALKTPNLGIGTSVQSYLNHLQVNAKNPELDLGLIGQRIALDELAAKYAIIDDEGQILSMSAGINKYVEFTEGPFQNNLIKLSKPSLRAALRSLFNEAKNEKRKASTEDCTLRTETHLEKVGVIVQPMPQLGEATSLFWVAFQYLGIIQGARESKEIKFSNESDSELVEQLEKELAVLRAELDKSVQDLEASNEELKSSNEELLSMNEELQSANEELETSKEDVQLANDALQRSHTDLENLLFSTDIATLFLDEELKIQNFTPSLTHIYNISRVDIGRPITDLTARVKRFLPLPDLDTVIENKVIEDDLELQDNRRILRRVTPYRTADNTYSGLVATFVDVTHLRLAETLRQDSEKTFQIMADTAPVLVWISGKDRKRTWFNKGWLEFTGKSNQESLGDGWQSVVHPEDLPRYLEVYNSNFDQHSPFHIEYRLKHVTGQYRWISARGVPRTLADGSFDGYIGACLDIHEQKSAREELRQSQERLQTLTEVIPQLVWTCLPDGRCDYLSLQWEEYTGLDATKQLELNWIQLVVHPDDRERTYQHWMGAVQGHHAYDIEYRIKRFDGAYRWFQARGIPIRDSDNRITRWFGTCTDIHEIKLAQEHILSNEKRLEMMIRTSPSFMCLLSGPDFVFEQANEHYMQLMGRQDLLGKPVLEVFPELKEQGFLDLLETVRTSGEPYIGKEVPMQILKHPDGTRETRYVDFVYQPSEFVDGKMRGVFIHGVDVTDKVQARALIENERENFRNLFKQTPEMVCILSGPDHLFEFVNHAHIRVLGFDATGKTVREAQPESIEVHGILDNVYRTGQTAELHEIPVTVGDRLRYFNLTYAAKRSINGPIDGVMILGTEVTDQVLVRESVRLQKDAFEHALNGEPMSEVLQLIAKMVEFQLGGGLAASIMLADHEGKKLLHTAAPSLPDFYTKAIDGIAIGPQSVACGTAAYYKRMIVVEDIQKVSLWGDLKELALKANLASCWSIPILSANGKLLGTFATYSKMPRKPSDKEIATIELASKTTALIIERQTEILDRIESDERLKFALASAKMGTWEVVLPTNTVTLSEQAAAILGQSTRYDSTDLAIDDFIHPEDRQHARDVLAKALSSGELYRDEYRVVKANGEVHWIHARGRAIYKDGKPERLTGIVLDIQAQKTTELELQNAKRQAEKAQIQAESANESKTRFLANMGHEIRTPLAAIIGFTEILQEDLPDDQLIKDYFERISRNAALLKRLIDDLLDLSKIEAEKLEIHETIVNVNSLMKDIYSTVGLKAEHKGIQLNYKWLTEQPNEIITDETRLAQILNNIIGNAVKFTEKGFVNIELSTHRDELHVRVSDSGIGLSPEHQKRIFEPFVQADSSITRKFGGTGLGLALSKKLAARLGGDLTLQSSQLGAGTTFHFFIRFKTIESSQLLSQQTNDPAMDITGEISKILQGRKILVVDDAQENRLLISLFLKAHKPVLSEASDGLEALDLITSEKFDLILMDIQMPRMDGHQTMEKIKEQEIKTPVIAITAHALREEKERCLRSGFHSYLTKPISKSALINSICETLTKGAKI